MRTWFEAWLCNKSSAQMINWDLLKGFCTLKNWFSHCACDLSRNSPCTTLYVMWIDFKSMISNAENINQLRIAKRTADNLSFSLAEAHAKDLQTNRFDLMVRDFLFEPDEKLSGALNVADRIHTPSRLFSLGPRLNAILFAHPWNLKVLSCALVAHYWLYGSFRAITRNDPTWSGIRMIHKEKKNGKS